MPQAATSGTNGRMKTAINCFFQILLIIWLTECGLNSPAPMTSEPSRAYRYVTFESRVEHVASTRIFDVQWAADSKTLFYTTSGKNWAYDVVSGSSMEVSLEELLQLTPKPEILSQLK